LRCSWARRIRHAVRTEGDEAKAILTQLGVLDQNSSPSLAARVAGKIFVPQPRFRRSRRQTGPACGETATAASRRSRRRTGTLLPVAVSPSFVGGHLLGREVRVQDQACAPTAKCASARSISALPNS
jgi:hypothetical protein